MAALDNQCRLRYTHRMPERTFMSEEHRQRYEWRLAHGWDEERCYVSSCEIEQMFVELERDCDAMRKQQRREDRWDIIKHLPRMLIGFGMYSKNPQIAKDAIVYTASNAMREQQEIEQQNQAMQRAQLALQAAQLAQTARQTPERTYTHDEMMEMARSMGKEMAREMAAELKRQA